MSSRPRIQPVHLDYRNAETPYSSIFDDIYFSVENGLEESDYLYIEGAGVRARISDHSRQEPITVGEIGFGVGLNFLLTLREFEKNASPEQKLYYFSCERFPVVKEDLIALYRRFPELQTQADALLDQYPILTPGFHTLSFAGGRFILYFMLGEADQMFSQLSLPRSHLIRHWYWDGFSPKNNPDAFSDELFKTILRISDRPARGSSFTVAGWVRRSLEGLGIRIEKRNGYGLKRECLIGHIEKPAELAEPQPWFSNENVKIADPKRDSIGIIGAGLAGSAIARALAERGFRVEVYDAHGIASQASGNPAGLYNIQLSAIPNPISRFSQLSLVHFLRELHQLGIPHQSGILRTGDPSNEGLLNSEYPESFYEVRNDSVFFPHCGILNPRTLCEARLNHPNIKITSQRVRHRNETGHSQVVYAMGADYLLADQKFDHEILTQFPFRSVRGQILMLEPNASTREPASTLMNSNYFTPVAPAITGTDHHILGSTYQVKGILPDQERLDTDSLIQEAREKWFPNLSMAQVKSIRVGYRLSTPDKLPVLGPLCDPKWLETNYGKAMRGGRKSGIPLLETKSGEWIFMGFSSRGIVQSSLGAEILASLMCGEPLPVENDLWHHLHSARFFVRNLKKLG